MMATTTVFSGKNYSVELLDGQFVLVHPVNGNEVFDSFEELVSAHPICEESRQFFFGPNQMQQAVQQIRETIERRRNMPGRVGAWHFTIRTDKGNYYLVHELRDTVERIGVNGEVEHRASASDAFFADTEVSEVICSTDELGGRLL